MLRDLGLLYNSSAKMQKATYSQNSHCLIPSKELEALRPIRHTKAALFSGKLCSRAALQGQRDFTGEPQRHRPSQFPTPSFLTSCHSSTRPQSPRNKQIQSAGFWAAGQPHSRASCLPITSRGSHFTLHSSLSC